MFRLNIVNDNIGSAFMSTSKLNDSILWHARLGHVHFKRMQDMSKDGLIPAFDMDTKKCKTCMLTKITKKPFQNVKRETEVLELIHSDLCDLHATPSLGNKKYFVTFIDDASRFCYVYLLHSKDEALDKFKVFKTEVELQQGSLIKRFRTDRGGLSQGFWGEAMLTACYLLNRVSNKRNRITLYELGTKRKPNLNYLRVWGCRVVHSKAFRFYIIKPNESVEINSIIESRDAIFDENRFSSVLIPSLKIPNGTEDIGGLVIPKEVTEEVANLLVANGSLKKLKVEGTIEKFKAMLVIQGFKQKSGIDYLYTYAPVACISIIRLLIAMASIYNLIIHQMDVKTTFLNGELEEEGDWLLMYCHDLYTADIAFSSRLGKLSKYTSNPGTQHWQAIQWVLKYLKKTMDYKLIYTGYPSVLEGYTDAIWINNTEDNSSTSGWVFLLSAAGKEAKWLKNLLLEIPLWSKPIAPISVRYDSVATLAKAYSQIYNGKSRHLGVRHSMIRELIMKGVVINGLQPDMGSQQPTSNSYETRRELWYSLEMHKKVHEHEIIVVQLRHKLDEVQMELDKDHSCITLREEEVVYLTAFTQATLDEERLSTDKAANMVRCVSDDEIQSAMFSIGNDKVPGPDGYTSVFLKKSYDVVGMDVCNAVRDFFSTDDIVSDNQSAFVLGRSISNNIFLTQELVHNYHLNRGPPRFNTIVTSLKALDESVSSRNHVRKFLRASKVLKKDSEVSKNKKEKYKSMALKAKKVSSDEEVSCLDSDDEEYAMANFQRAKEEKKGKEKQRCFKCGDPNHFISDCPQHSFNDQKAFVGGCWSDSEEEDDSKKDEICLVAHDNNEVLSDTPYYSSSSLDSESSTKTNT
ncbi:zinc finger, CCHC-type containing protein [Tanacetum coccineum]